MQILFNSRHPEAAVMREVVERRVRFVLRRLSALVPRVDVKLVDVNGPRGGIDKRCQIELRTDGAGPVVVSSVAKDWRTALDGALARAVRLVLRVWRRATVARRPRQTGSNLSHKDSTCACADSNAVRRAGQESFQLRLLASRSVGQVLVCAPRTRAKALLCQTAQRKRELRPRRVCPALWHAR